MLIVHGTWIPEAGLEGFDNDGGFYLWLESVEPTAPRPSALEAPGLLSFFQDHLPAWVPQASLPRWILSRYFLIPVAAEESGWCWSCQEIDCCLIASPRQDRGEPSIVGIGKLLQALADRADSQTDFVLGTDIQFWLAYTRWLFRVILWDEYVPALKYRVTEGRVEDPDHSFIIYPGWAIASREYYQELPVWAGRMPPIAASGFPDIPVQPKLSDSKAMLSHFSEVFLAELVMQTDLPTPLYRRIDGTLLQECYTLTTKGETPEDRQRYFLWLDWFNRLIRTEATAPFFLCFQLHEPSPGRQTWSLEFQVAAHSDPSQRLSLLEYWKAGPTKKSRFSRRFGKDLERQLMLHLGEAAQIFPKLWEALLNPDPFRVMLSTDEVSNFLRDSAWVLEDAGYRVVIPSWCSPEGQRRAKVRLKAKAKPAKGQGRAGTAYLSAQSLVNYQYDLALGDEDITEAEWAQLLESKSELLEFRGQWLYLDRHRMERILDFWKQQPKQPESTTLLGFLQVAATAPDESDLVYDRRLAGVMDRLRSNQRLEPLADPKGLQNGQLRPYQQRGLAWIAFLESLGLNGCLADDMGLGKSLTLISRLLHEREQGSVPGPTLLVAPTSVLGNWVKECEKFAPDLRVCCYYGSDRVSSQEEFALVLENHDLIITSFALVRRDPFFLGVHWHRVVVDEAQNIKNPNTTTTKSIVELEATHRLALTGTPVENRLMDLWSIFNFLNPGYLGNKADFRKQFELTLQRDEDVDQAAKLKQLVQPFLLRRLKTDPLVIQDLPAKIEQIVYCHLTQEQASMYQTMVERHLQSFSTAEGIQRQGLMLGTINFLKQVCNHPAHYLQDGSGFTPERSRKVERLMEMVDEIFSEQESCLIFSPYAEVVNALADYMRHHRKWTVFTLAGHMDSEKRQQIVDEFQDSRTGPAALISTLKVGGVGLTLTKANHVFHFDRWWNPAIEEQATDRAFRIGQVRNVFVHKFVTLGTLEEHIQQMLLDKQRIAKLVVEAGDEWLATLDPQTFGNLIRLSRTELVD